MIFSAGRYLLPGEDPAKAARITPTGVCVHGYLHLVTFADLQDLVYVFRQVFGWDGLRLL